MKPNVRRNILYLPVGMDGERNVQDTVVVQPNAEHPRELGNITGTRYMKYDGYPSLNHYLVAVSSCSYPPALRSRPTRPLEDSGVFAASEVAVACCCCCCTGAVGLRPTGKASNALLLTRPAANGEKHSNRICRKGAMATELLGARLESSHAHAAKSKFCID